MNTFEMEVMMLFIDVVVFFMYFQWLTLWEGWGPLVGFQRTEGPLHFPKWKKEVSSKPVGKHSICVYLISLEAFMTCDISGEAAQPKLKKASICKLR